MTASDGSAWTEAGLALMVLIWGLNFAVAKWALEAFEPLGFNALRHALAAGFMCVVLVSRRSSSFPSRADVPRILVLGVIGIALYQMAFIFGLDRTRAGNASLMLALVPLFLVLFGGSPRGAGTRRSLLGALLSVTGVAAVTGTALRMEGTDTLFGDLILVGAAGVWAMYTLGAQPLVARYGPIRTTAWTLLVGSIVLFLAGIPSLLRQDWTLVTIPAWGGVVFSSIFSIGLAYFLWYRGVQKLGGAHTALFSNLTPVVALLAGAVWLGERLTPLAVAGAALVIGGVMLVRFPLRR